MSTPPSSSKRPPLPTDSERLRIPLAEDFDVLEELGRGGMAIVFRARDRVLKRDVAIKVLPGHLMADPALVERFEHEARTAANLEHPNIIPIYRVGRAGEKGEVSYFVMKLLRGKSLSTVLRERGKLPADELRTLLVETASALGYAAKHHVVHRDIKPDNIMFDNEGRSVLTDFGIAKTPSAQHSAAGMLVGTPHYMSPEHALSQPLDGRSDLYSLGVVAYQSLFGKLPFDADDPLEIISKHIHEPLVAPPLRTEDERQLYAVISRMLAKRPEDRFQSAMDVIISLGGQVLSHAPVSVAAITAPVFTISPTAPEPVVLKLRPDPPPADAIATLTLPPFPTPKFARPRRLWLAALGVAGVVIAAAAFALTRDDSPVPATVESSRQSPVAEARRDTSAPKVVSAKAEPASEIRPAVVKTPPPAPPAKPKPSARAAAILAYNKLKSNCAKRDTMPDAAPIEYAVLLEPVSDRPRADQMSVTYDVCGLPAGTSFTANFTLTKLRQRGFRQQKPHVETALEKAGSPRSRESRRLDTREMSAGPYRLDIVVTDANQKAVTVTREFTITDK